MIKKLSTKAISFYSILIFFMTLFFVFYFTSVVKNIHLKIIKKEMSVKTALILYNIQKTIDKYNQEKSDKVLKDIRLSVSDIAKIVNLRVTVIDYSGTVLADSLADPLDMDNHLYRKEISSAIHNNFGYSIRYSNTIKTDMMYYAVDTNNMVLRLSKPLYEIDQNVARVRKTILLVCILMFFIALIINIIISRLITKPVHESIAFADKFSNGDFSVRIKNYGDDEVGHLQYTLNKLADNLEDKILKLRFEQDKLKAIIENIQDGIIVVSTEKRVILSNSYFDKKFYNFKDPRERFYYEVIRSDMINTYVDKVLLDEFSSEFVEYKTPDGFYYEVLIKQITGKKNLKGLLIVFHDITDRKLAEQMKTDLVGNLSHELKTPISILKGYLETISANLDDKKLCNSFIPQALKNVDRQNAIINDMLKLNKLEKIHYLNDENIDIEAIINNCLEILKPKYDSKKIKINFTNECKGINLKGNKFLVEEIFFNLIDNAINYNKENGTITVSILDKIENYEVTVTDSGIGISPDSIDRIFERFYRADKGRSRNSGGTGLGLSIVKHAVEILNWKIKVISSIEGSSFILTIVK